jgi:UDP:flavonoid glycosyltransferase YjiC (YdhE family)
MGIPRTGETMATFLLCSTPVHGHVVPVMTIGRFLAGRGHRVVLHTGTRFERRALEAGLEFRPLEGGADFDDRDTAATLPERDRHRGLAQAQYDIQTLFVKTIPAQYATVRDLLEELHPDAVLTDSAFGGVTPWLFGDGPRPPMLGVGVTPLTQLGRDVAPAGMGLAPSATPLGRVRNRVLNRLARSVLFRDTQRVGERMFAEIGAPPMRHFVMDVSRSFDRLLQLTVPGFEYPRTDLSPNVRFVGALPPAPAEVAEPAWWGELTGAEPGTGTGTAGRPVVHVTQGTVDNHDLDRLIRPTLAGLAELPVTVVVSMGGRPVEELTRGTDLPANARVASYLPYDRLLQLTDVFVTNGGYGGVQQSLAAGVPLVVAGDTEDKPEVAARVGWSGAGVNLRTGSPSPEQVREGVLRLLAHDSYRRRAEEIAAEMARYDTLATIEEQLLRAVARTVAG